MAENFASNRTKNPSIEKAAGFISNRRNERAIRILNRIK